MSDLLSGMIGSVVGGVIGGGASFAATWLQQRNQRAKAEADEQALVRGFLGAVDAEITVLWERYQQRVRPSLSQVQPGQMFNFVWPVRQDYFVVYAANASLLGRIQDGELRTEIVRCYTFAKGIVDSLDLNSELVAELEQIRLQGTALAGPAAERQRFLETSAVQYAEALKVSDVELESTVLGLLPRLRSAAEASPLGSRPPPEPDLPTVR